MVAKKRSGMRIISATLHEACEATMMQITMNSNDQMFHQAKDEKFFNLSQKRESGSPAPSTKTNSQSLSGLLIRCSSIEIKMPNHF